jgi:putative sterol carrier protein
MPEFGTTGWYDSFIDQLLPMAREKGLFKLGKEIAPDLTMNLGIVVPAEAKIGLSEDLPVLIKIEQGTLVEMKVPTAEELGKATLAVTMPYDQAKNLFKDAAKGKAPDMMTMLMGGKLKIKGDISKLMKYAGAMTKLMPMMTSMLGIIGKVETIFADELPPDKLEDFKVRMPEELKKFPEAMERYTKLIKEETEKA